jgi:hypothetical protein
MANQLPTRMCDGCGQVWASGAFLDPTAKADCEFCGGSLVHRRRLPEGTTIGLSRMREPAVEHVPLPSPTPTPVA